MEDMLTFTGWIVIIFGILQIILFFKVWIMTDNVSRIKKNLIDGTDASLETAKKEIMLGHPDKAFEIYNKCFINDIVILHKETRTAGMNSEPAKDAYEAKYQEKCQLYKKELSKLGNSYSIDFSRFDNFDKIDKIMS